MFKRILVLVGVVALAVGSTYAYFSATADSTSNVVTSGTLAFGTPMDTVWSNGNIAPGQSMTGNYSMDNAGSIAAEHLEIATSNTGGAGALQEVLEVSTMLYGYDSDDDGDVSDEPADNVVDIIAVITSGLQDGDYTLSLEGGGNVAGIDANSNGKVTLQELEGKVIEVRAAGNNEGLAAGSKAALYAQVSLPALTGDAYQGKTNTLTWTYTLNQDASQ